MEGGREGGRKGGRAYLDGVPALDDGGIKLVTEDGDVAEMGKEEGRKGGGE